MASQALLIPQVGAITKKIVTEQDANIRAFKYFHKHAPGFNKDKMQKQDGILNNMTLRNMIIANQ